MVKIIFTFFLVHSLPNVCGQLRAVSFTLASYEDARVSLVTVTNNLILKEAEDVTQLTTKPRFMELGCMVCSTKKAGYHAGSLMCLFCMFIEVWI